MRERANSRLGAKGSDLSDPAAVTAPDIPNDDGEGQQREADQEPVLDMAHVIPSQIRSRTKASVQTTPLIWALIIC